MSPTLQALVFVGMALEIALVMALAFKQAWKRFPIFTCYAVFVLVENLAAYQLYRQPRLYLYMYLVGECIAILLGLAVAYEIFRDIFARHPALRRLATTIFGICSVALATLAASVLYHHSTSGAPGFTRALTVAEEAARIMEVGAILFLFLFSGAFGLHWKQWTFGIALGLGVFVATKLAALTLTPYVSPKATSTLLMVSGISFDVSLLIWLGYLLAPERAADAVELPQHSQLEQWNQAILELIHQ